LCSQWLVARFCPSGSQTAAPPLPGAVGPLGGGGGRVVCMRDVFILNEIWTQDKIRILVGTLLV
jgi:hypothetical protein